LEIIIENINKNQKIRDQNWITQDIDLANGSLWFDTDLSNKEISDVEKQQFINLFNRIITGNKEYPVKLQNWNITFHTTAENAKENIQANAVFEIWDFININLWTDPTFQAMMNLSTEEDKQQ
jgi:hypothetical protein